MYLGGYIAQVLNLSSEATEKDVFEFFSHCGPIALVEILRSDDGDSTAYVTFIDGFALETAVLLSGARIADQCVCITRWGICEGESYPWNSFSLSDKSCIDSSYVETTSVNQFAQTPGEAITVAQQVVTTMLAKGYVLGKDALVKAKELDESYQLSSAAAGKIADLSSRVGLTDKINVGMEAARSINDKYHVSYYSKQAASFTGSAALSAAKFTGQTATTAAIAVVNSSYFAKGALWVSDVLMRASKAAAEFANKNAK